VVWCVCLCVCVCGVCVVYVCVVCVCLCVCVCVCVCVSVALPKLSSKQCACAVLRHLWPAPLYIIFPRYLINGTIFGKSY